jgi:hypothetical protein
MSKNPEDDTWIYSDSRAGFTSAIGSMERDSVRWVSWLGTHVERDSQEGVRRKLETEYSCSPVFLPRDIQQNYMRYSRLLSASVHLNVMFVLRGYSSVCSDEFVLHMGTKWVSLADPGYYDACG